eukprot:991970_1
MILMIIIMSRQNRNDEQIELYRNNYKSQWLSKLCLYEQGPVNHWRSKSSKKSIMIGSLGLKLIDIKSKPKYIDSNSFPYDVQWEIYDESDFDDGVFDDNKQPTPQIRQF